MSQATDIVKLRKESGAGIMDCKRALEESKGNFAKAKDYLFKKGLDKAAKKMDRETGSGLVYAYIHHDGELGVLLKLACESDFVARTDDFKKLAHELAMQIASMKPKDIKELASQAYIRDSGKLVGDLVKEAIAKMGENIKIEEFCRLAI